MQLRFSIRLSFLKGKGILMPLEILMLCKILISIFAAIISVSYYILFIIEKGNKE